MGTEEKVTESEMLGRESYWSELSAEEKVERMRGIVKDLSAEVRHLRTLHYDMENHQHGPNGELLIPIDRRCGPGA